MPDPISAALRRPISRFGRPRYLARLWSRAEHAVVEPEVAARLRAAQIVAIARYSTATLAGTIVVALILAIVLQYRESCPEALPWLAAVTATAGPALYRLYSRNGRGAPTKLGRRATRRAAFNAALFGLLWGAAPALFFDAARPDHLIVACIAAGMLCAGAIALAPLPVAMLAYTAPMLTGCLIGLARGASDPIHLFILPLLLAYFGVLVGSSLAQGRQFAVRVAAQARAEIAARHDPLTGLPNRTAFSAALEEAFRRCDRYGERFALLFIDLDDFKAINDRLGHQAGDQLLQQMAGRLSGRLAAGDTLARLGGDEFVLLARSISDATGAAALGGRISDIFATPFILDGGSAECRASIGMALAPADGEDATTLLAHADAALYKAKADRNAGARLYRPAEDIELRARRGLTQAMSGALARGEFFLEYQPIYRLGDGRIGSVETLVRWRHPDLGLVPPDRFIPIAEECGAIHEIGEWIMAEACRTAADWPADIRVAVNVSAEQIRDRSIVAIVESALRDARLDSARLMVEVTESATLAAGEGAASAIERLHARGVGVVLDDFGTGYSSFDHIRRLPVTSLKIDRSFVRDLPERKCWAIVQGVAHIAHALELDVTAEGVETETQLEFVKAIGCRFGQGYLFARPQGAAALAGLMPRAQPDGRLSA